MYVLNIYICDLSISYFRYLSLIIYYVTGISFDKKTIDQIRLHSYGLSGNKESHLSFNVSSALMAKLKNVFNKFQIHKKSIATVISNEL